MRYCFYHESDYDGIVSGVLVKLKYPDTILKGINYGHSIDIDVIPKDCEVWFVDFCPEIGTLLTLVDKKFKVIVIDHHLPSFEKYDKLKNEPNIKWLLNIQYSGCYLASTRLFNKSSRFIDLLSNYDTNGSKCVDEAMYLQYGLDYYAPDVDSPLWPKLMKDIAPTIKIGEYIAKFELAKNTQLLEWYGFRAELLGLKAFCINTTQRPGKLFWKQDMSEYDVQVVFKMNKKGAWLVNVASDKFDCNEICSKFGGGGHTGIGGFRANELPLVIR